MWGLSSFFSMLIVSLPLLGVGSNFLEGESQSWILCSFLVTCLGESINMLGVLQEAEDAERRACMRSYFKLNISSIPTLSHLLDCLICTRSSTFIVLFLQGMGWFDRWHVVDLYQVVGSGIESVYYHIVLVFSGMYFYLLFSHIFWYRRRISFQVVNLLFLFILLSCFHAGSPFRVKTPSS